MTVGNIRKFCEIGVLLDWFNKADPAQKLVRTLCIYRRKTDFPGGIQCIKLPSKCIFNYLKLTLEGNISADSAFVASMTLKVISINMGCNDFLVNDHENSDAVQISDLDETVFFY